MTVYVHLQWREKQHIAHFLMDIDYPTPESTGFLG